MSNEELTITQINANYRNKTPKAAIEVNAVPPPTAQTRQAMAGIH
jgi:hypothetical protein